MQVSERFITVKDMMIPLGSDAGRSQLEIEGGIYEMPYAPISKIGYRFKIKQGWPHHKKTKGMS
jgi:hypothetical protein